MNPPKTKKGRPLGSTRTSPAEMIARYPEAVELLKDGYSAKQAAEVSGTSRGTCTKLRLIVLADKN